MVLTWRVGSQCLNHLVYWAGPPAALFLLEPFLQSGSIGAWMGMSRSCILQIKLTFREARVSKTPQLQSTESVSPHDVTFLYWL